MLYDIAPDIIEFAVLYWHIIIYDNGYWLAGI